MATQFASITSYNYPNAMQWIGTYEVLSQDPVANTTKLRLYGSLRDINPDWPDGYGSGDSDLRVNGVTVYSGSYRQYYGTTVKGYTDKTVTHNADGTFPSQSISIYAKSFHFDEQSATGTISGIPSLDRVAPTVTVSLASRTSNSLTINATASATCDYWEFSRDDGSTFPYTSSTEGTAVSYTFTGLSPNTTYNIKVRARKKVNQLKGTSARGAYTTIGNALLNSVAEFYADASTVIVKPNMTVYGASFTYTLEIKRGNTSILTLTIPQQSTGTKDVSVTLSPAQRTTLLSGMSNVASFSATYILKTLNNGTQVGSTSSATATIRTSSSTSAPGQASFSYADTNAKTVAVTGDSTKLVQGQSTLRLTNLTATAKNGASVASYNITIGGVTKSVTSGGTVEMGVISQSGTLSLSVVVTDTRGYTSTRTVSVTSYAYAPPSISAYSVKRNASTSTQIDMSFSGVFSNIGSNTVTAKYKYKQSTAGSYSADTSVTPTTSGGTFSYSGTNIATFDDEYVYDFVITLSDGIITETYYITVPSYNPLMAFRPNRVGFGMIPQNNKSVEIAQDWRLVSNGSKARFHTMPDSFQTYGGAVSNGYARIARVVFTGTSTEMPIEFQVKRRDDSSTIHLYFRVTAGYDSVDPTMCELRYDLSKTYRPFEAFCYRVTASTWDIYVKKNYPSDWQNVRTIIPEYMADRTVVTYSDSLLADPPQNAIMAVQLPVINSAKNSHFDYLPYSWYTSVGYGQSAGYARICTIELVSTVQEPIHIKGTRRVDATGFDLYLQFDGNFNLKTFYAYPPVVTAGTAFEAFIYQRSPKIWDVYVRKVVQNDCITVWVEAGAWTQEDCKITYSDDLRPSVPSGATLAYRCPELEPISVTLSSAMTANTFDSNCFYNIRTHQVHIEVMIYSANASIPTTNGEIFNVPDKYRPSSPVQLGMATVIDNASWTTWVERCYVDVTGKVALNNFIYGSKATRIFYLNADYIAK